MSLGQALGISFLAAFTMAAGVAKAALPEGPPQQQSLTNPPSPEQAAAQKLNYDLAIRSLQWDFANRIIHLDTEINESTATALINQLRVLDEQAPGKPITLKINSPGGKISSAMEIYDVIHSVLKSPVNTECESYCGSIGLFLLATGAHRTVLPHANLMMHGTQISLPHSEPGLNSGPGPMIPLATMKAQMSDFSEEQQEVIDALVLSTGEEHRAAIVRIFNNPQDTPLTTEKAKALGLIDEIKPLLLHGLSSPQTARAP